jgi:hypothetical protein
MFTKIIQESEIEPIATASLPTRPTATTTFGGKGYTANEMQACFDALPRLAIERLNQLIMELQDGLVEGFARDIDMERGDGYAFSDFIEDFGRGTLVNVLNLGEGGEPIGDILPSLIEKVNSFYYMDEDFVLNAGRVTEREVSALG